MPLTDTAIRNAKPSPDKAFKMQDEKGLYLLVNPNGSKYFRYNYRYAGKRKTLALGVYPSTTLKEAREKRDTAKKQIDGGIDPGLTRKIEKSGSGENSFKAIANEFMESKPAWSASHKKHVSECFNRDVFPWIGSRPVKDLTAAEVLVLLRRIVDRGALETAARTKQFIGQALRYGVATGRAERDVTGDLRGALPSPKRGHFAAITDPKPLADLLRAIDAYEGSFVVKTALRLQPLIFARPANLAAAEWREFDLDAAEWRIDGEKMKTGNDHIVPLSLQAVELLREIYPLTGHSKYVFYSVQSNRGGEPHISRETIGASIRRMGFKGQQTAHGFRTTASTLLHEQGFHSDMIERQLAHAEQNRVKAAYNRAQHLPERRRMMQAWGRHQSRGASDTVQARASVTGSLMSKPKNDFVYLVYSGKRPYDNEKILTGLYGKNPPPYDRDLLFGHIKKVLESPLEYDSDTIAATKALRDALLGVDLMKQVGIKWKKRPDDPEYIDPDTIHHPAFSLVMAAQNGEITRQQAVYDISDMLGVGVRQAERYFDNTKARALSTHATLQKLFQMGGLGDFRAVDDQKTVDDLLLDIKASSLTYREKVIAVQELLGLSSYREAQQTYRKIGKQ